eukprot:5662605-Pleurochrysis_carterae.AAC.1
MQAMMKQRKPAPTSAEIPITAMSPANEMLRPRCVSSPSGSNCTGREVGRLGGAGPWIALEDGEFEGTVDGGAVDGSA